MTDFDPEQDPGVIAIETETTPEGRLAAEASLIEQASTGPQGGDPVQPEEALDDAGGAAG